MEGKIGPATFLPLSTKIGGQTSCSKDKDTGFTSNQVRHIYEKVEKGSIINIKTIK